MSRFTVRVLSDAQGVAEAAADRIIDAAIAAVAERVFNHLAQMRMIDHDLGNAGAHQINNVPDNQRPAPHFQQRLGASIRQRPHTLAATGGEDHCFHFKCLSENSKFVS